MKDIQSEGFLDQLAADIQAGSFRYITVKVSCYSAVKS